MALLDVLQAPDPRLRQNCSPVSTFDESLSLFVSDLIETMYAHKGVGIAAPQVGRLVRVCLVDTPSDGLVVFVNPVILEQTGSQTGPEGCLSLPGVTRKVCRAQRVKVKAFDETGKAFEAYYEDLTARAVQHEIDHLSGKLMVDR